MDALVALMERNGLLPGATMRELLDEYFAGARPEARWIVAEHDGLSGVAMYAPEPLTEGSWNMLLLAVDPLKHNGGIGRALVDSIERDLAKSGARLLLLETSGLPSFERTRGFYERLGYEREAAIRDYYQLGEDKIIYCKRLLAN